MENFENAIGKNKNSKVPDETLESRDINPELARKVEDSKMEVDDKINFLLTKGGLKPASVIELPVWLETEEGKKEILSENEIREVLEIIKESGLNFHIREREIIKGSYRTEEEPEVEKFSRAERIEIMIADSKENLELLKKCWGTDDHETIGKVLGFPQTAVEAFTDNRKPFLLDDMPKEMQESDGVLFLTPALSKDNWQEEIKEGEKRAEFIKKISPKIYAERKKIEYGKSELK